MVRHDSLTPACARCDTVPPAPGSSLCAVCEDHLEQFAFAHIDELHLSPFARRARAGLLAPKAISGGIPL